MKTTVIIGGGGHAKVVIEVMRATGEFDPIACVAADAPDQLLGVPVMGDDSCLTALLGSGIVHAFVAIGNNHRRALLIEKARKLGFQIVTVVSPAAIISPSARLGEGVVIMPGAHIGTEAIIGDGTIINSNSNVDHDCVIEENCHLAPGGTLAGGVTIRSKTFLGTGVSVIPYIQIGARTTVGAGSVVIRDVPDDMTTFGVPAHHQALPNDESDGNSDSV